MSKVCNQCGAPMEGNVKFCEYCGARVEQERSNIDKNKKVENKSKIAGFINNNVKININNSVSTNIINGNILEDDIRYKIERGEVVATRSKFIAILLAFLFGLLGIHRFYLGQFKSGGLYVLGIIIVFITGKISKTTSIGGIIAIILFCSVARDIICYIRMNRVQWCYHVGWRDSRGVLRL